ncbi:MAG: DNA-directed RNA polymerase subunit beta, partial [Planctomycetota bacterium]
MDVRNFSKIGDAVPVPDLTRIQTEYYDRFLQKDMPARERKHIGLESVLQESFPIQSYDKTMSLEYVSYSLGRPRYSPAECKRLRLTYGYPFKVWLRLKRPEPVEEEVHFGELPVMLGGGEFIINGAERVIVTQLHRSPGIDFLEEIRPGEKKIHTCRIIPERGSWIEINVTKRDVLALRIDQSTALPATVLLRALSEEYSSNEQIYRAFYPVETVKLQGAWSKSVQGRILVREVKNAATGEVLLPSGSVLGEAQIDILRNSDAKDVEVISDEKADPIVHQTILEDPTRNTEDALLRIYARLRPGNPSNVKKAKDLFRDKFLDSTRYRLGRVGRFRLNRKIGLQIPESEMTLSAQDLVEAIRYLMKLRSGQGHVDDIDHLGNRRLRTIDELAGDEIRKGLLRLRRTVQERMSLKEKEKEPLTPRTLVNSKTIFSSIESFFGRGELLAGRQFLDLRGPVHRRRHLDSWWRRR